MHNAIAFNLGNLISTDNIDYFHQVCTLKTHNLQVNVSSMPLGMNTKPYYYIMVIVIYTGYTTQRNIKLYTNL